MTVPETLVSAVKNLLEQVPWCTLLWVGSLIVAAWWIERRSAVDEARTQAISAVLVECVRKHGPNNGR